MIGLWMLFCVLCLVSLSSFGIAPGNGPGNPARISQLRANCYAVTLITLCNVLISVSDNYRITATNPLLFDVGAKIVGYTAMCVALWGSMVANNEL